MGIAKKLGFELILLFFLFTGFMFSTIALSANWVKLGELADSPKFGKTDYYADIESIEKKGDVRTAWLKSVFSKPQDYKEGKTFTNFLSFTYFDCSNKTQAVTQIDVYSLDGKLVGSEKQGIKYLPVRAGSLDQSMYEYVCGYILK